MTNFRACLRAFTAGTILLFAMQNASAQVIINFIDGQAIETEGGCVDPTFVFVFNCTYDGSPAPVGNPAWQGPTTTVGTYPPTDGPFDNIGGPKPPSDPANDATIWDASTAGRTPIALVPQTSGGTPGDGSEVGLNFGADGSFCTPDDRISGKIVFDEGTRFIDGGQRQYAQETFASGVIKLTLPETTTTSQTPAAGGCTYEIASQGFPELLDVVSPPPSSYPAFRLSSTTGFYVDPFPAGKDVFCGTNGKGYDFTGDPGDPDSGNCGITGSNDGQFDGLRVDPIPDDITKWKCNDNAPSNTVPGVWPDGTACKADPNDSDLPDDGGSCGLGDLGGNHYCGRRNKLENVLVQVTYDADLNITSGTIFLHDEDRLLSPPPPLAAWNGPVIVFAGLCDNCEQASDDTYTVVAKGASVDLPVGLNDIIQGIVTVTADMVASGGGIVGSPFVSPGLAAQIKIPYTPSITTPPRPAPFTETFDYTSDASGTMDDATVTANVVPDAMPVATPLTMDLSTAGVAPASVTGTISDAASEPGNDIGNDGVITEVNTDGPPAARGTPAPCQPNPCVDITYQPNPDFFAGSDSFSYTIEDFTFTPGGDFDEMDIDRVTVNIADVNPAVAGPTTVETNEGEDIASIPVTFTLGNGDLSQHTLETSNAMTAGQCSIVAGSESASGTAGTAVVEYVADPDFFGDDTCEVDVTDGDGDTATGTIVITVIEDKTVILFPGGSALDPWSLVLLLSLPFWRRRPAIKRRA